MSRDDQNTVYCNIQMPMPQGEAVLQLMTRLLASGEHPDLENVFKEIQDELNMSIEFVNEQISQGMTYGRRNH